MIQDQREKRFGSTQNRFWQRYDTIHDYIRRQYGLCVHGRTNNIPEDKRQLMA